MRLTSKARILAEADTCTERGDIGALLRCEGLYSSHLSNWRRLREAGQLQTLGEWLRAQPGIEIVTRGRSQTYADAIQQGAPEAIQVADRWHLLKNLSDVVFKILQQEYGVIKKRLACAAEEDAGRKIG